MNKIWNYGGNDYRFDISERECMEKINSALGSLREDVCMAEGESTAALIEGHCRMIASFFDTVFGEGSGRAICGDTESAEAYSAAYLDFIMFVSAEVNSFAAMSEKMGAAYAQRLHEESEAIFK